jgi:hypothetical protein
MLSVRKTIMSRMSETIEMDHHHHDNHEILDGNNDHHAAGHGDHDRDVPGSAPSRGQPDVPDILRRRWL